jgi:DNA-binding MarR family transcriptional regulator
MASKPDTTETACAYVVGDDGLSRWADTHRDAWIGLLETHKRLTRALETELEAEHGLSLSALELMGRLAAADDRVLRLTDLSGLTGLSLSRISRIVDALEARKLVERRRCPEDARARNAWLTGAGLKLLRDAQALHFAGVQRRFFDEIGEQEVAALAAVFGRFAPGAAEDCTER